VAISAARTYHSKGAANLPDREVLLDLFERMILLRRFETIAQIACRKGETPGFLHLYIGQEATGVGICAHLRPTDWVTSTHRGHGQWACSAPTASSRPASDMQWE
jgi:2-oxoisovalerate dehydrogenase E1 component